MVNEIENTSPEELRYATVAVDQPVDAAYTYGIPEQWRRELGIGSRVMVPLGRGNRLTAGTVLELLDEPPAAVKERQQSQEPERAEGGQLFEEEPSVVAKQAGVKLIADVVRDAIPIPADLLELAKWISTYYVSPIGMTIASMVPAAVKRGTRLPANVMVSLTARAAGKTPAEALNGIKMSPKGRAAFEKLHAVLADGEKTEQDVLSAAELSRPTVKRLAAMGLVDIRRQIRLPDHGPVGAKLEETQNAPHETPGKTENRKSPVGAASLTLTGEQQAAMVEISRLLAPAAGFGVRLIHGVTGSGKTEVYIRAIEQVVAAGKRAIVLVPEISLTPQTVRRFTARFPRVAVLHSGLKDTERHQHWYAIATGWAQVIVGARSAIFAPAKDIGLIVVDEEHDSSYKQDSLPKYHGRDVAIRRAQMLNIPVLLGSATPALESWHNAHHNPHWGGAPITLANRPMGTEMPRVVTVDMKAEAKVRRGLHILSATLEGHLKQTLEKKKQAIFLLNRRGYAHYLMCPRCDWVLMCENCDATMVVHRTKDESSTSRNLETAKRAAPNTSSTRAALRGSLAGASARRAVHAPGIHGTVQCHYCLTSMVLPTNCPLCQARLTHLGQGTQRAEDELLRKFPGLRLKRVDSDSMGNLGEYQKTLDAFGRGEIDLLIGTQMIAKGLDFPNVTLVGVLNADLAMTVPDFRAAERTFQLICQVAGRSGRATGSGAERGTVVVQTFQPAEPAIAHACRHDYLGFVRSELPHRKEFAYPPYGRLVRIVLSHSSFSQVRAAGEELLRLITALVQKRELPIRVQGPIPPPMERMMEQYRVEIVMFSDSALPLQRLMASLRARGALASGRAGGVSVSADVDPLAML